jgi:hypothetical protein
LQHRSLRVLTSSSELRIGFLPKVVFRSDVDSNFVIRAKAQLCHCHNIVIPAKAGIQCLWTNAAGSPLSRGRRQIGAGMIRWHFVTRSLVADRIRRSVRAGLGRLVSAPMNQPELWLSLYGGERDSPMVVYRRGRSRARLGVGTCTK